MKDAADPAIAEKRISARIQAIDAEIQKAIEANAKIEADLPDLNALVEAYRYAQDMLARFKLLQAQKQEQTEVRKLADVQVMDPPVVTLLDSDYERRVLLFGCGSGLAVGSLLAILLEFRKALKKAKARVAAKPSAATPTAH